MVYINEPKFYDKTKTPNSYTGMFKDLNDGAINGNRRRGPSISLQNSRE